MRFSPKALTFTMAWPAPAVGLGVSGLMKRASALPVPPLMSALCCVALVGLWVMMRGRGVEG